MAILGPLLSGAVCQVGRWLVLLRRLLRPGDFPLSGLTTLVVADLVHRMIVSVSFARCRYFSELATILRGHL